MKKLIISFTLIFSLIFSNSLFAIEPKLKIIGTMSAYGVVGGALLGSATMAFGASSRAIARGASLGLYAGLLFGTYVIASYEMKKRGYNDSREDYYPDSRSQYEENQSSLILQDLKEAKIIAFENKKDPRKDPLFSINLLNFQF